MYGNNFAMGRVILELFSTTDDYNTHNYGCIYVFT